MLLIYSTTLYIFVLKAVILFVRDYQLKPAIAIVISLNLVVKKSEAKALLTVLHRFRKYADLLKHVIHDLDVWMKMVLLETRQPEP